MKTKTIALLALIIAFAANTGAVELQVPTDYATIQEAVNVAAAGDTIRIWAGDYFEQVLITNKTSLTLAGESGAVLHAIPGMNRTLLPYGSASFSVLGIVRSAVVITGLTFDGENLADRYTIFTGIDYLGSSGRVENCAVRRFRRQALAGFSTFDLRGMSIWNGVSLRTPTVNVGVFNSTFEDNQTSILVSGDEDYPSSLRTSFIIQGNTVTGFGPIAMAVDGIVIYSSAGGEVSRNTIRNHLYTGPGQLFSGGIAAFDGRFRFVPLQAVRYEGNTFSNNTVHLAAVAANGSQVLNNVFDRAIPGFFPWAVGFSGASILVANNDFSDMTTGIALFGGQTYPSGGHATNPKLISNWFCNVTQPIRIETLVTGLQQQGTELCENNPLRATFQSIRQLTGGGASLTLRSWHGEPLVIEASTDLQNWSPVHTNSMTLPSFEHEDTDTSGSSRRFYRAFVP